MRTISLIPIILMLLPSAVADVSIGQNAILNAGGQNITFDSLQNFTSVTVGSNLSLQFNGTHLNFSGTAPLNLNNISYVVDRMSFSAGMAAGTMTTSADMQLGGVQYGIFVDGSQTQTVQSDPSSIATFQHSIWSNHNFIIEVPSGLYFIDYKYLCTAPYGSLASAQVLSSSIVLVMIVLYLIFIVKLMQENALLGLITAGITIVFVGTLLPSIADYSKASCTDQVAEPLNLTGQQDRLIQLARKDIERNTERIYNGSYVAVRDTDYLMKYVIGKVKPLSSGGLDFS